MLPLIRAIRAQSTRHLALGLLVVCLAQTSLAQTPALYERLHPIESLLNEDGTLATTTGFSGRVDVRGWRMLTASDGTPRFIQESAGMAGEGDENWDDRFGLPGVSFSQIYALAQQGDDLYAGGWFQEAAGLPAANVARWDGRMWSPLGTGVDGTIYAMAVYDGALYVGGMFDRAGDVLANSIARWDGTTWSIVGDGVAGQFGDGIVYALAVFDGALYVGGEFNQAGGAPANGIARWNGTSWSTVGTGVTDPFDQIGIVYALAASANALYVGGSFDFAGGEEVNNIARWNGTSWAALGSGISGEFAGTVKALAIQGNKVYAGGAFNQAGGVGANGIAVWDTGSASWSALAQGIRGEFDDGEIRAILPVGGDVYVAGNFAFAGTGAAKHMAKWNGTGWSALVQNGANGADAPTNALLPGAGGSVYYAGEFTTAGDLSVYRITQWNGNRFLALGQGVHTGTFFPATIYAVAVSEDGKVYVGGQLHFAGSTAAENIAMWDGEAWHPLGSGVNQFVYAIATWGNDVYVGGRFTSAGDQSANYIARWNATTQTWSALGSGMNGYVWDIAVNDRYVYAVGDFTAAGTVPAIDMARWDGTEWSKLGRGIEFTFNAVLYSIALDGERVWIGGDFESVWVPNGTGAAKVNGLLLWDSTNDEWFEAAGGVTRRASNGDVWGSVYDLLITNGALYVTGRFDKAGGQVAANGVARFDGETWSALGSSLGGGSIQEGYALVASGQDLYVGGRFTTAGGITSGKVARYNMQTQTWAGLGQGIQADDANLVWELAVHGDDLYAGGYFITAGGKPSSAFAHWTIQDQTPINGPLITVAPASLSFSETAVGQTAEKTITITNAANATAALNGTVGAPDAPFSVVSGGGTFSLAPGQSRQVVVRFAPTAAGSFNATLAITHNAGNRGSPANVALSGTATSQQTTLVLRNFNPEGTQGLLIAGEQGEMEQVGFVFGPNRYGDRSKGTFLTVPGQAGGQVQVQVQEIKIWFAYKRNGLTNQTYTLKLYNGDPANGPTGEPVFSQTYNMANIQGDADSNTRSEATVHTLPQPVTVNATFFVDVDFGTYTAQDLTNAAIASGDQINQRVAEVWERWENGEWHNVSDAWSGDGEARGWQLWIEATVTPGTSTDADPVETPTAFALAQNHPNPFNPATTIQYTLLRPERVVLKVYDVAGREVATLVDEPQPAGMHTVLFEAAELSSGVYFYRLAAGAFSATKKMTLVK